MDNAAVDADARVLSGVVGVLERYNTARHPIVPATDLAADLNVDSVAAMDLVMEIEDRFEIDIPINLVSDMTTVADLVALVERQLKTRDGAQ
ncbi:MAG: acyl carrier protein [Geminicoccaceae bacterium]